MDKPFRVLEDWVRDGRLRLTDFESPGPEKPMPQKVRDRAEKLSSEELFEAAMEDVRRRSWNDASVHGEPIASESRDSEDEGVRLLEEFCRSGRVEVSQTKEYVEHWVHPVGKLYLDDLRTGRFAVQAHLDLHGLSLDQARRQVDAFLIESVRSGYSCVRIVHGRGRHSIDCRPLLKRGVERWLRHRRLARFVLAYTSARMVDGGGGAVYVLLAKSSGVG